MQGILGENQKKREETLVFRSRHLDERTPLRYLTGDVRGRAAL